MLNAPFITLTGTVINWISVESADNYIVYCEHGGIKEVVGNTQNTIYDLDNFINQKITNGIEEELNFSIVATARANYSRSAESNTVKYTAFLQLPVPTYVGIYKSSGRVYLQWRTVEHCEYYVIKVNKADYINVRITDCTISGSYLLYDITSIFSEYGVGEYQFQVKSAQTNNYLASDFSPIYYYTHKPTLAAPQNVVVKDLNGLISISWDPVYVELYSTIKVSEYELWLSDVSDSYQLKQFFVNNDGVQGLITTNSISITYEQMGITSFAQIKDDRFMLRVIAKEFGYTSSAPATIFSVVEIDHSIDAPNITDNDLTKTINWLAVANAETYRVSITSANVTRQFTTTNTYFTYGDYLTEAGSYNIKCLAVTKNGNVSEYSNVITKTVNLKLSTPSILNVTIQDEYFTISFEEVANALEYTLYSGEQVVLENMSASNNSVLISEIMQYKQNGKVDIQIKANATGYYDASDLSDIYYIDTKLATPNISISGNNIVWNSIENATSFKLYLDDNYIIVNSSASSIDLSNYVEVNVSRQVRLQALSEYFDESDISNTVYYNRVQESFAGYTDKYFYFGQTYDYYITSEQEMLDVVNYVTLNFLPSVNVYINFDNETSIITKLTDAINKKADTFRFSYSASNSSSNIGKSTLTFTYATITDAPDYTPTNTQYDKAMIYSIDSSSRNSNHEFITDTYSVSQDVYSTDGLISALEHKAKPNFVNSNSVAEAVYNKAKEILIEICDDDMNDYYKALAIHDYIITHVSYDVYGLNLVNQHNAPFEELISQGTAVDVRQLYVGYFHYVESAMFYGLAVCDGYSKMYSLLCNMEGIDCLLVGGLSDKTNESSGHAWNKISFDIDNDGAKECFVVDCTHDDPYSAENIEYAVHEYFLVPDSVINQRYENEYQNYPPTTEATDMFYSASQYTPYNLPLKIDNYPQGMQYLGYLTSPQSVVVEGLILRSLWEQIVNMVPNTIGYRAYPSIYSNYVLVIAYK